jgi:redox-sensitive bicupin YhaK (pirin superfamily)
MIQIIPPRVQDIGFTVKRLLPSRVQQRVGPFIFVDHMGPAAFERDTTSGDVRQHPHIGLSTVTYLFTGAMMHKDSLGVTQRIEPGAINLMTAGKGIVHSERVPDDIRNSGTAVEGMQTWLASPTDQEQIDPSFHHYGAERLPMATVKGGAVRVLVGAAEGLHSPVKTLSPTLFLDITLDAGSTYTLSYPGYELGAYVVSGEIVCTSEESVETTIPSFHLGIGVNDMTIVAKEACRIIILGGEPLAGDRFVLWNFVSSTKEGVREAAERWRSGGFTLVPGEKEFIPFPDALLPPQSS